MVTTGYAAIALRVDTERVSVNLSNRRAAQLVRELSEVRVALREHAAEQSYRRDAMKAIGERNLALFHDNRHSTVLGLLAAIDQAVVDLRPRVKPTAVPMGRRRAARPAA